MQLLQSIFIGWIILLSRVNPHYTGSPSESSRASVRAIHPTGHIPSHSKAHPTPLIEVKSSRDHRTRQRRKTTMKSATIVGILLILLGIVGFLVGGITFTQHKQDVNVGPLQIGHDQKSTLPISPILSTIALIGGVGLVAVGAKS